jgi:outer membrane biosynthesis protein TonB
MNYLANNNKLGEFKMDTVRYLRRKNLGNYEHEELEVSTVVEDGQSRSAVTADLRNFVNSALNGGLQPTITKAEPSENKNPPKGETKVLKEKPQTKKEEPKAEEVKEEPKAEEAPAKEEPKAEEPKKEKAPKKETTTKIKPSKATAYDRELDTHKALLGKFLDSEFPGWRKSDLLKKAVAASHALKGSDFQDGEGNILESFKVEFRKHLA